MVKQYRVNAVVEAIQYDGANGLEIMEFAGRFYELQGTNDWVVKNMFGEVIRVPNEIFRSLYTSVNE